MTEQDTQAETKKTLKDHLKAFGGALFIVGLTLLLLEGLVRFTDPWGLSYFNDVLVIGNELFELDDVRGYVMVDGQHELSYWDVTIENGARVTPNDNPDAECTFIMLGDSVTLGHGINDDETWINQLAIMYPDIHFVNTGMSTYNSVNVLGSKRAFPDGDAYIYLLIDNDIEATLNPDPEAFPGQNPTTLPFLVRYASFMMFGRKPETFTQNVPSMDDIRMQRFISDIDALLEDGDTWLVSFDYILLAETLQEMGYDISVYPYPPYSISYVDFHLNPQGNLEFAESIAPLIAEIRAERCPNS
ncbi:MAG: hypothetical protein Q9P01_06760 [Anaerolineae bacterium]|nr:hypothetical protein [Anaerolineae bacterium]MDQ7034531.1 hypothetical protein [Anaerolineae bacterium]